MMKEALFARVDLGENEHATCKLKVASVGNGTRSGRQPTNGYPSFGYFVGAEVSNLRIAQT